ncbi:MAG TPA: SDR family NAD(P)-dependent oxidoreductase, partial [Polyangia bacterium]|nr:SDR family NAD(P)-dependent oxidoreductase [Polyangia bacterium]
RLLASWGLTPLAMIGHSVGEYVAACLAGVLTPRDAMRLAIERGRLVEALPPAGMLVVPLAPEELNREEPDHGLSIAAVDAPELCVASGPAEAVAALEARLAAKEIDARRLPVTAPAHAAMLDPILPELERFCRTLELKPPSSRRPYVSNLTGTWMTAREACDPSYWVRHLRQTVRFAEGLATLLAHHPGCVILEVGPGRALTRLAGMQAAAPAAALPTMARPGESESGVAFLLGAVGQLWAEGAEVDWTGLRGPAPRRRVPLPTYPFERDRYWIDRVARSAPARASARGALRREPDVAGWFWLPSWSRTAALPGAVPSGVTLVFADDAGLGAELAARLPGSIVVRPGPGYARLPDGTFTVAPDRRADYERLVEALRAEDKRPDEILHLWAVTAAPGSSADALARYDRAFDLFFASPLALAQALALEERPARLTIVSNGLHRLGAEPERDPLKAMLLGPARVIGAERPALASRSVDVSWPPAAPWQGRRVVDQLLAEVGAARQADPAREERVIAYRGAERLVESFERAPLRTPSATARGFRDGGVYVITGGLGGIGATLAEDLARSARAKLVLVSRTAHPEREKALRAVGAELFVTHADVTNLFQMRGVMKEARARFGAITGVIHAAGVLEEELVPAKTLESAARVMAPKVKGALVLDALAREAEAAGEPPLELFLMFSSVSAVLGPRGAIDDASANAFLGALALERAGRSPEATIAVDWGGWREADEHGRAPRVAAGGGL